VRRSVISLGVLGLLAIAWLALAPTSVGGQDTYVITSGDSMYPTIKTHSAVVLRKESDYHVGEIAAYRNPDLGGALVLHRIVKRDGQRYVFKGDNNQYPDFYEPHQGQLVGAKVFYSHGAGQAILNLRTPILGALMLGSVALWILWPSKKPTTSPEDHPSEDHE
jgi:signal peptidase I